MAQYLLDENLSRKMIGDLLTVFYTVLHVKDVPLVSYYDAEIWDFAKENNYYYYYKRQ